MKKILLTLIATLILIISCNNEGGSIYAMKKRYRNFINILPENIKDDYLISSSKYSNLYNTWVLDFENWTTSTIEDENVKSNQVALKIAPNNIEYAIGTLTNRNYERNLPIELITAVKQHTDMMSVEIDNLLKDNTFSNKLNKLKTDEAIEHFNTKDTVFYYIWNYLVTLERPRRFQ